MATTVLSGSPQVATPVYNKMLFKVSGSLIAQPNYRYVCDVKNPAGTTLARLKCDKLPSTNFGFFDVAKVVETLIAPTKPSLTQTGFVDHAGYYSGYRLDFMEEYGNTPVVYTGTVTTVSSNVSFAGNLEQLEFQDWTISPYFRIEQSFPSTRALTSQRAFTVYHGGSAWLAINATKYQAVAPNDTWLVSGRVTYKGVDYDIAVSPSLSGTTDFNIQRFACGPAQLSGTIAALSGAVEGDSYTVRFYSSTTAQSAGNVVTFTFGPCERFDSIPVHFQNKYGGIDSYTFTLKNRKRANISRQTFGYNSDIYATTTYDKVWAGEFDYVYALNSDWLTDAESAWLIEMVRSGQVWLELDGQLVEAIVNANTYQFTTRRNDRLTQLQVEVAVAYKNNIL
jgi:hypothetical protein